MALGRTLNERHKGRLCASVLIAVVVVEFFLSR